jgi:hypothetical protein
LRGYGRVLVKKEMGEREFEIQENIHYTMKWIGEQMQQVGPSGACSQSKDEQNNKRCTRAKRENLVPT